MNALSMTVIGFQCGIFRANLCPDSRGYVLFHLEQQNSQDQNLWAPLSFQGALTCEHLTDLFNVVLAAMQWISQYCDEITEEGQHLYFKFREEKDAGTPATDPAGSNPDVPGPGRTTRLSQALLLLGQLWRVLFVRGGKNPES